METLNEIPGGLWTLGAAFLTAVASVAVAVTPRWLEARERIRQRYAASTEILASWVELPYRIARRTSDDPDILSRLAETAHELQERTANTVAWVAADNRTLGELYQRVVAVVRDRCGEAARTAWERPYITTSEEMNVGPLIDKQEELDQLLNSWTCQAVTRIGLSRTLLWLPTAVLLRGRWNRGARLNSRLDELENEDSQPNGGVPRNM